MGKEYPGIVFFSGGTALAGLSRTLAEINPGCSYIVTTFDSGGSSARLRDVFGMPAVGDARHRIISLADDASPEIAKVVSLLSTRFSEHGDRKDFKRQLKHLVKGSHPLLEGIPALIQRIFSDRFELFIESSGDVFDPSQASLGNILLAAGFLFHRRGLTPPIAQLSRLIGARGIVRTASVENAHLAVRLEDGEVIAGQHLFTGKEVAPISSPIDCMWTCLAINDPWPRVVQASSSAMQLVNAADLIVYPMGSFYSSIVASLTPRGMGRCISANPCPKIFIPNLGHDPELLGHSVGLQAEKLLEALRMDNSANFKMESALNAILIDSKNGVYENGLDLDVLRQLPVKILDRTLVSADSQGLIDPVLLANELMNFAQKNDFFI